MPQSIVSFDLQNVQQLLLSCQILNLLLKCVKLFTERVLISINAWGLIESWAFTRAFMVFVKLHILHVTPSGIQGMGVGWCMSPYLRSRCSTEPIFFRRYSPLSHGGHFVF